MISNVKGTEETSKRVPNGQNQNDLNKIYIRWYRILTKTKF